MRFLCCFVRNEIHNHFRQEYCGKFAGQCAVHTKDGVHCPDEPVHFIEINGKRVGLCERCYQSYLNGVFHNESFKRLWKIG